MPRSRWNPLRHALCSGLVLLAGAAGLAWALVPGSPPAVAETEIPAAEGAATPPTEINPAKVMGFEACVECHKPAVAAWQASTHARNFKQLAQNPNAVKYAQAMNIPTADITQQGLCVRCHGLKAEDTKRPYITGVSCESCHGAAGGDPGWLNPHASYGANGLKRDQETPEHRKLRLATEDKLGMVRAGRPYQLARNCLGCHLVPNEELVNKGGHHPGSGDFELVGWIEGDVCHNMFLTPARNQEASTLWMADTGHTAAEQKRLFYVLGQLAQMDIAVRNLANSKADGTWSQAMAATARKARGTLNDLVEAVPALGDVKPVMDGFKKIALKLKPEHKADLLAFADQVTAAANQIAEHPDKVFQAKELDDVIPRQGKGTRYEPPK